MPSTEGGMGKPDRATESFTSQFHVGTEYELRALKEELKELNLLTRRLLGQHVDSCSLHDLDLLEHKLNASLVLVKEVKGDKLRQFMPSTPYQSQPGTNLDFTLAVAAAAAAVATALPSSSTTRVGLDPEAESSRCLRSPYRRVRATRRRISWGSSTAAADASAITSGTTVARYGLDPEAATSLCFRSQLKATRKRRRVSSGDSDCEAVDMEE